MAKKISVLLLTIVCMCAILLVGCDSKKTSSNETFDEAEYKNVDYFITPQELKKMIGSKDLVLLDCNKPNIYEKGHIPGAVSIGINAFSDISNKIGDPGWGTILDKEALQKKMESLGIDNTKTVVFYSDVFKGPGADGRAVWQSKVAGMNNVKMLVGGLSYWEDLGYETTDKPEKATPTTGLKLKDYDTSYIATKEYVKENLGKEVIIDVRTKGEYEGSQKAGEPRGGHIKGAVNMPWLELLNDNGTPKSKEKITKIMASYGVKPDDTFVVY
ncbi:MAG: rhodanese-like domain-containing protein [Romboutsia sp.]